MTRAMTTKNNEHADDLHSLTWAFAALHLSEDVALFADIVVEGADGTADAGDADGAVVVVGAAVRIGELHPGVASAPVPQVGLIEEC